MIHLKNSILLLLCLGFFTAEAQKSKPEELEIDLSDYQYPYEVQFLNLNIQRQELQMGYMDVKPQNHNGRNVMLLHGKNFNGAYWRTTIEALTKNGYRVIVPDQIGFGKSAKPDYLQYSFHQLARNTKKLLDTLGVQKTAVLGHSMGGMLATRFALMYPETTEKLILENPIGLEDYKRFIPYKPIE
jgi:pimeloyl-ACP methyl ester carboxylesterase